MSLIEWIVILLATPMIVMLWGCLFLFGHFVGQYFKENNDE
jgi:hypothetical protein